MNLHFATGIICLCIYNSTEINSWSTLIIGIAFTVGGLIKIFKEE